MMSALIVTCIGGVFEIEFTFIDRLAANYASHCLMVT